MSGPYTHGFPFLKRCRLVPGSWVPRGSSFGSPFDTPGLDYKVAVGPLPFLFRLCHPTSPKKSSLSGRRSTNR